MTMVLLVVLALAGAPGGVEAAEIEAVLARMEAAYAAVHSYTARFIREERIGDVLRPREEGLLKFQRPGRLYLRWIAGPPRGREILFVEGRDDERILVHEPAGLGRLFTIAMPPDSPRVFRESRHPITDVGVGPLLGLIAGNARRALRHGDLTVVMGPGPEGAGRRVELVLPREPAKGYYCYRALVSVDGATGLPVEATIFDWDDRQVAFYAYRDLKVNVDFTARDFDAGNPEYAFPRWRLKW